MTSGLVCWRCGADLTAVPQPFGRRAECPSCGADLHVCLMCEFYDPGVAHACREPVADEVKDKDRANFCGYFQPRPGAFVEKGGEEAARAKAELEALFGLAPPPAEEQGEEAGDAEKARRELERLFSLGGDDESKK